MLNLWRGALLACEKSIRMCISCRKRFLQKTLLRLSIVDGEKVVFFVGKGRSFYLCPACLKHPKIEDRIIKIKKLNAHFKHQIKEIIALWESQLGNLPQN